jgi:NAD-dependent DNA ligase
MNNIQQLEKKILYHNDQYHNGTPVISDNEYDDLVEQLSELNPNSNVLSKIGAADVTGTKTALPYFLASMNKHKVDTINKYFEKFPGPKVVSMKLDGISCLITNTNGSIKIYTRGNGSVGSDITSQFSDHICVNIDTSVDFAIRGELIISKVNFEVNLVRCGYKNSRNVVAGIANCGSIPATLQYVEFIAYETILPSNLVPLDQFAFAKKIGFQIAVHEFFENMDVDVCKTTLKNWKCDSKYEIDGIIISDNLVYDRIDENPKHAVAFKMNDISSFKETTVVDVVWSASKHGLLKPVIHVEPVDISGATIRKCTGINAKFIKENSVGVGTVVKISRSGDVIPKVEEVVKSTEAKFPDDDIKYHWTSTNVDIVLDEINDESKVKANYAFFKGYDITGMGEKTIKKFYDARYDTIPKILKMSLAEMIEVIGDKIGNKIFTSITKLKSENYDSLEKLMARSNCFERGLGSKKLRLIVDKYDIFKNPPTNEELCILNGFSTKTALIFQNGYHDFMKFAEDIAYEYKPKSSPEVFQEECSEFSSETIGGGDLFKSDAFCMTGFRDPEIKTFIEKNGGIVESSMTKKVTAVICKNREVREKRTGKIMLAHERDLPVLTADEFRFQYMS